MKQRIDAVEEIACKGTEGHIINQLTQYMSKSDSEKFFAKNIYHDAEKSEISIFDLLEATRYGEENFYTEKSIERVLRPGI